MLYIKTLVSYSKYENYFNSFKGKGKYAKDDYISTLLSQLTILYFHCELSFPIVDVDFNEKDLYGTREIALPTPHFVVFYNGIGKRPEIETMKLSTSFCHETENPELEVICTAYNINPDYNKELKEKSRVLYGYTIFVEKVRRYATTIEKLEEAIKRAIDECIEENILKEFFLKRRKEVEKMTTIDCRFETREKLIKRDAYEDGFENGFENGVKSELINTEREKTRADAAEQELEKLKKIIKENNIKID